MQYLHKALKKLNGEKDVASNHQFLLGGLVLTIQSNPINLVALADIILEISCSLELFQGVSQYYDIYLSHRVYEVELGSLLTG